MRITNLFWTVVLLAPLSVFAQQQKENLFTIDAQIRTRGEYRNGVLNPRPEEKTPLSLLTSVPGFLWGISVTGYR